MELVLGGEAVGEEVLLEVGHLVEVVAVLLEMANLFQLLVDLEGREMELGREGGKEGREGGRGGREGGEGGEGGREGGREGGKCRSEGGEEVPILKDCEHSQHNNYVTHSRKRGSFP